MYFGLPAAVVLEFEQDREVNRYRKREGNNWLTWVEKSVDKLCYVELFNRI